MQPPSDARFERAWRWAFGLALVAVLILALKPNEASPELFPEADKVRHVAAFVVLWLVGARARLAPPWMLAVGLLLFGVSIEILQSFTPSREASLLDLLADAVGITLGWFVSRRDHTAMVRAEAAQRNVKPPAT